MLVLSLGIFNACHAVSLESDGLAGLFYEMKQPSIAHLVVILTLNCSF